jgi:hypothetical protein
MENKTMMLAFGLGVSSTITITAFLLLLVYGNAPKVREAKSSPTKEPHATPRDIAILPRAGNE